jgi:hypothetical protein
MNKKTKITKDMVQAYEDVRQSGETNMFMISTVCSLSGLERTEVTEIMKNYDKYVSEFGIER